MSLEQCLDAPHLPKDEDGPLFSAPWEARAFAMVVKLYEADQFTWAEWIDTFSGEIARAESRAHIIAGHTDDYYECWVLAMEKLLKRQGLLTEAALNLAIANALENWPHPDHVARPVPIATSPGQRPG